MMSLKQEIEKWVEALDAYDNQNFEEALRCFAPIAETSKIWFNCGVIYATLGEHHKAVECYQRAVSLDQYLAIAYFQQGVSNFLLGDFEEALANFNDTLLYLRGNTSIDYEQLGLLFRLFSCEVLFNRGLCYIYLRQMNPGIQDLEYAAKEKVTPDHDVIDDAIRENADGYTVFSIPVGVLYRPNAAKVKNLKTKDYLGKARLVAASDRNQSSDHQWNPLLIGKDAHKGREGVPFATSNLVRQNLSSRTRQQSEPPLNRTVFPPTPPPDDRSTSTASGHHRASSLRGARPARLELDRPGASLDRRPSMQDLAPAERPRIGTTRTASEPRGPSSRSNNMRGFVQESSRSGRTREQTNHRRHLSDTNSSLTQSPEADYSHTPSYDPYSSQRNLTQYPSWGRGSRHQPPQYIDEEEEYGDETCDAAALNDGAFQLVGAAPGGVSHSSPQRRTRSPARYSGHSNARRPEIQKFRTKVHAPDDTRYIMIGPNIEFAEFEKRIREKFGFKRPLKMKVQDDGDMITMVDQEDLDLLVSSAKEVARREGSEMGKIEIWVEERAMI
ncbi:hypothetical protein N7461_008450 [Penicillium sp. DV-2018c]|nr:hypothetical protein N7461_008450 [Penicillium sp. DV-2018c]